MKTLNNSIEITKEEAISRLEMELVNGEKFYNTEIQLKDGTFSTATLENIETGVKFWIVK